MFIKAKPQRRDRSDEFANFAPRPRATAAGSGMPVLTAKEEAAARVKWHKKLPDRKSTAVRDSARGEDCSVRIPGCPGNPEQTIWSHAPLGAAGKGRSIKALDLCGAYACTYCDGVVDGQIKAPDGFTRLQVMLAWHDGHMRSLVLLRQKGLV